MFYQFDEDVTGVSAEDLRDNVPAVGYVNLEELSKIYRSLNLPTAAVEMCSEENRGFSSCIEIYDDCFFIRLGMPGKTTCTVSTVGVFITKSLLLIVNISEKEFLNRDVFMNTVSKSGLENAGVERIVISFFDSLAVMDKGRLDKLRDSLDELEETVINNKADKNFNIRLLGIKKRILSFRGYYESLIDIAQILSENDNEIFDDSIKRLNHFTDKMGRMRDNIDILTDSVVHLWDAYQASLNMKLNETMKVFTLVTTIFFPLTVIVGWYGMNFTTMPELRWKYGYIYVIVFSALVIAGLIWWFKKKKWI